MQVVIVNVDMDEEVAYQLTKAHIDNLDADGQHHRRH